MRVVCIGDSITGEENLAAFIKWSNLLELMLEVDRGFGSVEVKNSGIGGNTTVDVLKRLNPAVGETKPDIVILLIGGNDRYEPLGITYEMTKANLSRIIDNIQKSCNKILMLKYHLLPDPEHPEKAWRHLVKSNPLIEETAWEKGLPLLDTNHCMLEAAKTHHFSELVCVEDSVHLNPGGELVYAREIFKKLKELDWI